MGSNWGMEFHVLVREPAAEVREAGLLVLLHGYGADEKDLMGLSPALDPSLRILSVRAPHPTPMGGFAWFGIEFDSEIRAYDLEQAAKSLDDLVEFLSELRREVSDPMAIVGFSQGAMMALAAVARDPALASSVGLLSGKAVAALLPSEAPAGIEDVRFLVQHGAFDPLVPVANGREIDALLSAWGAPHAYREYPMGHAVSAESLDDLATWLGTGLDAGEECHEPPPRGV